MATQPTCIEPTIEQEPCSWLLSLTDLFAEFRSYEGQRSGDSESWSSRNLYQQNSIFVFHLKRHLTPPECGMLSRRRGQLSCDRNSTRSDYHRRKRGVKGGFESFCIETQRCLPNHISVQLFRAIPAERKLRSDVLCHQPDAIIRQILPVPEIES